MNNQQNLPRKSIDIIQKTDLSINTILDLPTNSNEDNFLINELIHSSNVINETSTNELTKQNDKLKITNSLSNDDSTKIINSPATIDSINTIQSLNNSYHLSSTTTDKNNYYSCGHCEYRFIFNQLNGKLVICPSCKLISSIDEDFKNTNGILYLLFFSILLLMADNFVHLVISKNRSTFFYYFLKTIFYLSSIGCLWRSIYYFTIKISSRSLNNN